MIVTNWGSYEQLFLGSWYSLQSWWRLLFRVFIYWEKEKPLHLKLPARWQVNNLIHESKTRSVLSYEVRIFKKIGLRMLHFLHKETPKWFILTLPLHVPLVLLPGLPCLVLLHNYEFFVKTVFFQKTVSVLYFTALSAISASCAL